MARRLVGNNHVNLTVSDLQRSTSWYCRVFGLTPVSNHDNVGPPYFNENTYAGLFDLTTMSYVVGLIEHRVPSPGRFDERRVGLDHFGLQVPERSDLDEWAAHLDGLDIPHSGILDAPYAYVINFRDPDGIALELSVTKRDFWVPLVMSAASSD